MSDYIKREDAAERVAFELMYEAAIAQGLSYKELFELEAEKQERIKLHVQKWLEQVPSADVVKARHAEWQLIHRDKDFYKDVYQCSECRFLITGTQKEAYVYCPNCGARIDGERKE